MISPPDRSPWQMSIVSGMTYKCVKPSAELKPMRVTEAKLADGTPINPEARYTVAYNSYIASVARPSRQMQASPSTAMAPNASSASWKRRKKWTMRTLPVSM